MSLYFEEEVAGWIFGEIVAGEFGCVAVVLRAVIDELKEIDLLICWGRLVAFVVGILEVIAEAVGCEAHTKARSALAVEGFNSTGVRRE